MSRLWIAAMRSAVLLVAEHIRALAMTVEIARATSRLQSVNQCTRAFCSGKLTFRIRLRSWSNVLNSTDLASPACVTYYKKPTSMYALDSTTISFGCGASSTEIPILPTPTKRGASQEIITSSASDFNNPISSNTDYNTLLGITPSSSISSTSSFSCSPTTAHHPAYL